MSNRTRSNPQSGKLEIKGKYTVTDRFDTIKDFAKIIADKKAAIAQENSYKTPDEKRVERCKRIIQDCMGTVRIELRNMGITDETMVSQIAGYVEKNEIKTAYNRVRETISGIYTPVICR